jgi:hypothetical protein
VIDEREWLRIWNEPDLDGVRSISADDLEVNAVTAAIEPRHYQGPEAAVRWLVELKERIRADWTVIALTPLADDALLFEGGLTFIDPASTGNEAQTFAILMRLRGDKVRWIGTFMTAGAARDAWELGAGSS